MNRDSTIKLNQGVILYDQNRFDEAIQYFKNTCDTDSTSLYMLGICYLHGNGVTSSREQAAKYFMKAAEKNHWQSIVKLAQMSWYSQEYEYENVIIGMHELAWRLEHKTIDDEDDGCKFYDNKQFPEAIRSFETAHMMGSLDASFWLGKCYLLVGDLKNISPAKNYFLFAAKKGQSSSQYMMGQLYLRGYGVTQDYVQAAYWFYKAAQKDHQFAKIELEKLLIYDDVKQYIENFQQHTQNIPCQNSNTSYQNFNSNITESRRKNNLILGICLLLGSVLLGASTTEIPAVTGFCVFGMLIGVIITLVGLIQYFNN